MTAAKRQLLNEYLVQVRLYAGTYVTRAHGTTVSCTAGAQQAVERLATKLWGEGEHPAYLQPSGDWLIRRDRSYADLATAAAKMEEIVATYIHDYEYDDGESCHHTPNETEAILIEDAIQGLIADDDFVDALTDWRLLVRARKAASK